MSTENNATTASNPAQAFQALDVNALKNLVGNATSAKEEREAAQKSGGGGNFLPSGFLQAGNHKMRIFADPAGQLYRSVKTFKLTEPYKQIMDPRFYKKGDGTYVAPCGTVIEQDTIERVWDLTRDMPWQDASRYSVLVYIYLIETDKPDDKYWKPGTLYLGVMNGKFEEAYMGQLAKLSANDNVSEHIAKAINPTVEGWAWDVTVVKGSQGSVSMSPTLMIDFPAVEIDDSYKPLIDQYVKDEYNAADVARLFSQLEARRIELGIDEPDESDAPAAPNPDSTGESTDAAKADTSGTPNPAAAKADTAKADAAGESKDAAAQANAMFGGGTPAETKVETKEEVKTEAAAGEVVEGTPEAKGLNTQQLTAAKAAGMSPEEFASVIGLA